MKRLLLWALASCALLQAGCAIEFHNVDLFRPTPIPLVWSKGDTVTRFAEAFPAYSTKDIKKSFRDLESIEWHFDVQKYSDWKSGLDFSYFESALKRFPENPQAWAFLASYLALQRQPAGAIAATEEAFQRIEGFRRATGSPGALDPLERATKLNRSIYLNLDGRYDETLRELDKLSFEPDPDEQFQRVAAAWMGAVAKIGLGQVDGVVADLDAMQMSLPYGSRESPYFAFEYPQYFVPARRDAVFSLLRAEARLKARDVDGAMKELDASIASDSRLWDAKLLRANVLFSQGQLADARDAFEMLAKQLPRGALYNDELVLFNLGSVYLALDMPDAAIDAYEHMLRESQGRSERFRRQISETLPLVVRAALPQEGHEQIVVEAHNNLGVALLRKAELGDANVDALSDEAISHFQWGRDTQPGTAWTNIARGYWMKRNYNEFVGAMENALKSGTNREEQSEMLLNLSIKADDPQVRYVGISAYLEQVEAEPSWRADRLRSLSSMVASLVPMPEAATLRARIANLQTDKRGRE